MTREELERLWHLLVYQSGEPLKDGLAVIVNDKSDESTYEKLHGTLHAADIRGEAGVFTAARGSGERHLWVRPMAEPGLLPIERVAAVPGQNYCPGHGMRPGVQRPPDHGLGAAGWKADPTEDLRPPHKPYNKR